MAAQPGKTFTFPPHIEIGTDANIVATVTNDNSIHVWLNNAAGNGVLEANLTTDAAHVLANALTLAIVEQEQAQLDAEAAEVQAATLWGHGTASFDPYLAMAAGYNPIAQDGHIEVTS